MQGMTVNGHLCAIEQWIHLIDSRPEPVVNMQIQIDIDALFSENTDEVTQTPDRFRMKTGECAVCQQASGW